MSANLARSLFCFAFALLPAAARAQSDDAIGVRAQGMGGAFTAVADDASATWWNPAGVARGAYGNAILDVARVREPRTERSAANDPVAAWRIGAGGFATSYPALGLSYYRLRISDIQPTVSTAAGRQDTGTADVRLRSLVLSQYGATVGQSLGNHLVIASTVKIVSGTLTVGHAAASDASLDAASALDGGETHTHTGLDIGAMVVVRTLRAGVTVRNVRRLEFGSGDDMVRLDRHARAGFALSTAADSSKGGATLAVDADLTTTATVTGDERRVALGGEAWTHQRVFGVRAGISASTIGSRRSSVSGGFTAALKTGLYLDAATIRGGDAGRSGWTTGLRVTF